MVFQERTYSVLIVTASERFTDSIMPLLPMTDYWPVQTASSVAEARRWLADTEFDIVLINTPLPDDFGMHLAIDICTGSGAWSGRAILYLLVMTLGNAVGGVIGPVTRKILTK